ncbi:MAG: hypothetical protein NUV77_20655 [Thermoguttaceae bacterium]|jgi:squalene cyclase|nr:hypothetical protein [Thermoguttaceae bacterium]
MIFRLVAMSAVAWSLAVGLPSVGIADGGTAPAVPDRKTDWVASVPHPKPVPPPKPEEIQKALRRGVDFLLSDQNKDGSWGSAHNTKGLNIYAPVPGAHQAFRAAVTSLCIAALIESGIDTPEVRRALDRGETWLLANLPNVRRATPDAIYNNWAHCYSIQALVRMHRRHAGDVKRQEAIRAQVRQQIDMLRRYECVDGGWCYYDFNAHTQRPSGSTISFVTGAVLVALDEARALEVEIPQKLIDRALESMRRQRKPDFSYAYGEYLKYRPMHPVNRPGGGLGRSQCCNLAMRRWGDRSVTDEVLGAWLDRLFARNLWLDIGRKRPIPHESWFMVAGYFFYFGHYYAARCIEELPTAERPRYQAHLAQVLLALQEKDGSWWDYPLYDYHQPYGTAFAIMSLVRCR